MGVSGVAPERTLTSRFLFVEEDLVSYPHGEEHRFTHYDQVVLLVYGQMEQSRETSYGKQCAPA